MNILFLTLLDFKSIEERNIYTDLLREFVRHGHRVFAVSPAERRKGRRIYNIREKSGVILKLRIGNTQKTGVIEKGISTMTIEPLFIRAVKKYFHNVKFGLVLYSTPPITFCKAVEYVKKRDGADACLLLKDIFPQNAVDMGMLGKRGILGVLYRFFRRREKRLYHISDRIGCMSEANVEYILRHNPEIDKSKVGVCPNSIDPVDMRISGGERNRIRGKYGIPLDKTVFVYGGNLGKPQGIDFMLKCLDSQRRNMNVYFVVIGSGTEFPKVAEYVRSSKAENVMLRNWLPKEEYDKLAAACDVGMIFLDHRFTVPNFPSRLLSYMQAGLPVLAVTDTATDVGEVITGNGFGWWCESDDVQKFAQVIGQIDGADKALPGMKAFEYLEKEYTVKKSYGNIMDDETGET